MNFKKIKYFLTVIIFFLFIGQANAGVFETIGNTFKITGEKAGYEKNINENSLAWSWQGYVNGLLIMIGAFFLLQMIYGGWLWMSARGNDQQVEKSKHIILNSLIALGIIIGAKIIAEIVYRLLGTTVPITQI